MDGLVDLETLRRHLRLPSGGVDDVDLADKLTQAHAIVLEYLGAAVPTGDDAWTSATVPAVVAAAILRQAADLYRHRGDEETAATAAARVADGYLSPKVTALLHRLRRQVVA